MASKKRSASSASICGQKELFSALCAAGYELDGFTRKGSRLVIRLTPADLIENDEHLAHSICDAHNLQARCIVFPQVPHPLLIVTVQMPTPNTQHPAPNTGEAEEPRS